MKNIFSTLFMIHVYTRRDISLVDARNERMEERAYYELKMGGGS
jgi:hypothetical protein